MLENIDRIHFIGIGGVGVNALAKYALDCGLRVSGSDAKINSLCKELMDRGAAISEGEDGSCVDGADLVVYSSAIKWDNAELARARVLNIPTLERQQLLHEVASGFHTVVGIAGTHGKTTTTAMLSHILASSKRNFASMIGGESVDYGNYVNNCGGDKDIFVVEACEYKRNFLTLNPTVAVVTNVECDHPDCYADISDVRAAFDEYLSGAAIKIYAEGDELDGYKVYVKTKSENAKYSQNAGSSLNTEYLLKTDGNQHVLFKDGKYVDDIVLGEGGDYNFKNAMFAVASAGVLGIDTKCALDALRSFRGVKRRFELGGYVDGVPVYFDFAHHPTEIGCVLDRASEYGKILAVFQPHTYSRTQAYFDDFVKVFGAHKSIGTLVLMPTYAARENPSAGCDADELFRAIVKRYGKMDTHLANSAQETLTLLKDFAAAHDIVLFIGAGDIYDIKSLL